MKKILAIALIALTVMAVALPALAAVETGVLTANCRVWKTPDLLLHFGYAQLNDRVQVIGTSTIGADREIYVKVVLTSGSMQGVEGYVLQRLIRRTTT